GFSGPSFFPASTAMETVCAFSSPPAKSSAMRPKDRVMEVLYSAILRSEMKTNLVVLFLGLLAHGSAGPIDVASPADQIASAIQAAPKERRADATVLGYNAKGEVVTLRKGSNEMICLAYNPADK